MFPYTVNSWGLHRVGSAPHPDPGTGAGNFHLSFINELTNFIQISILFPLVAPSPLLEKQAVVVGTLAMSEC